MPPTTARIGPDSARPPPDILRVTVWQGSGPEWATAVTRRLSVHLRGQRPAPASASTYASAAAPSFVHDARRNFMKRSGGNASTAVPTSMKIA